MEKFIDIRGLSKKEVLSLLDDMFAIISFNMKSIINTGNTGD